MIKKIIFYISLFLFLFLNILLDCHIQNYVDILRKCFNRDIVLDIKMYMVICFIIAVISILMIISIKLILFYKKEEIKGIHLKTEDGTYRHSKLDVR